MNFPPANPVPNVSFVSSFFKYPLVWIGGIVIVVCILYFFRSIQTAFRRIMSSFTEDTPQRIPPTNIVNESNYKQPPTPEFLQAPERPLLSTLQLPQMGKDVFNVSQNLYKYSDAAALCKAFDSELASYDQVKEAYEKGADWCNYGWIKGQMAVYPTQKETWEKLQKGEPEYRKACGTPGVNGGYFDNPDLRFGVNCYGIRPSKSASDDILESQVAIPQTSEQIEFEKKVQVFREQVGSIAILPYQ